MNEGKQDQVISISLEEQQARLLSSVILEYNDESLALASTTTTRYKKTRSGLLLQLRTVHHGRLALVRCQLQNPPTSYLVGQRVVVVLEMTEKTSSPSATATAINSQFPSQKARKTYGNKYGAFAILLFMGLPVLPRMAQSQFTPLSNGKIPNTMQTFNRSPMA